MASLPYDHELDGARTAPRGRPRGPYTWDWPASDGALALDWEEPEPEPPRDRTHLKPLPASGTVPRMASAPARGLAARSALRERQRAKMRQARRLAGLVLVAGIALVVLLLTAFGSGDARSLGQAGPAPAQRLLPPGPPQPLVIASYDTLRIGLPINQARVTAIGYHASGAGALELEPVGSQANAGVFGRLIRRLIGDDGSGVRYYQLSGGIGPRTGGLDVGAPVGTDVYAPVDGTVIAISDQIVDGKPYGKRIEIQPAGNPGVVVALENLETDPVLRVGSTLVASATKLGRLVDLSPVEEAGLARYTQDAGQHVHIEVHPAASLSAP
jgi:murein DD-endopeptidase MepM/ murein hydrolase activator NlpD